MLAIPSQALSTRLRTSVLLVGAFGILMVTGVALAIRPWLQLGAMYPGKAAALFAATTAIVFGSVGAHHPYRRFGPANHVTMIRAMLVVLITSLIGEAEVPRVAGTAAPVAAVATVLDGVDGWLARRSRMVSEFGARFDVEIDAFFMLAMSVLVWQRN